MALFDLNCYGCIHYGNYNEDICSQCSRQYPDRYKRNPKIKFLPENDPKYKSKIKGE